MTNPELGLTLLGWVSSDTLFSSILGSRRSQYYRTIRVSYLGDAIPGFFFDGPLSMVSIIAASQSTFNDL